MARKSLFVECCTSAVLGNAAALHLRYHLPGTGTPHSYQPTNGWRVRLPITPNVTGSCLYARKNPAGETNKRVISSRLRAFLRLQRNKGRTCLVVINSMLVLLFTCLTLQFNTLQRPLHLNISHLCHATRP